MFVEMRRNMKQWVTFKQRWKPHDVRVFQNSSDSLTNFADEEAQTRLILERQLNSSGLHCELATCELQVQRLSH